MRFPDVVSLQIEELPPIIREDVEDFLETHPRSPAAQLRPKFGVVGSVWLARIHSGSRHHIEHFGDVYVLGIVRANVNQSDIYGRLVGES